SKCISEDGGVPHFILDSNESCPFLNEKGLCDIIISEGEECLCEICKNHPRYKNYYSDRIEIGIGIACEAAAEMVVFSESSFELVLLEDDGEETDSQLWEREFFQLRRDIFELLCSGDGDIWKKVEKAQLYVCDRVKKYGVSEMTKMFLELEHLDSDWERRLEELGSNTEITVEELPASLDSAFERLAEYFIYRHLSDGAERGDIAERVSFAMLSVRMIALLCAMEVRKGANADKHLVADIARRYSAEIEYSVENTETLIDRMFDDIYG
ncbi:MAG: flagellin lysine-N-methylase, partial [Clostridia bacterium]|nr:flagellin lysine-N-methylase [Clostridia bacterium]